MEHLTDKEIFDFAHISSYDAESLKTVNSVNRHIMACRACAEKVSIAVRYYDAVASMLEGTLPLTSEYGIPASQVALSAVKQTGEANVY